MSNFHLMRRIFVLAVSVVSLMMSGCGEQESLEELAETAVVLTVSAASPTPTVTKIPTATNTATPNPPKATPTPATGSLVGRVYWVDTKEPVVGVGILLGGIGTEVNELYTITNEQGKYVFESLEPGDYSPVLTWTYNDVSDLPCTENNFIVVGEWFALPLSFAEGGYGVIGSYTGNLEILRGEEARLDIAFVCS